MILVHTIQPSQREYNGGVSSSNGSLNSSLHLINLSLSQFFDDGISAIKHHLYQITHFIVEKLSNYIFQICTNVTDCTKNTNHLPETFFRKTITSIYDRVNSGYPALILHEYQ